MQKALGIVLFVVVAALVGLVKCPPPSPGPPGPPAPWGPPGPWGPPPPPPTPGPKRTRTPPTDPEQLGEYVLYNKLFAPDAEELGPEAAANVLDQLAKLYIDRIRSKGRADKNELRRRMQVFSLLAMADLDPSRCTETRPYALNNSIEFFYKFPNVVAYLQAKQMEQMEQCRRDIPGFQPF